jgi:hypothetical protein
MKIEFAFKNKQFFIAANKAVFKPVFSRLEFKYLFYAGTKFNVYIK